MTARVPTIPSRAILPLVLLLAIILRVVFFVGLVSGDPQDDGIYYGNALSLRVNGPDYLNHYKNLPEDFLANPIDQFNVRPMITYPLAASFAVFGSGEVPASAWAFLCSVLSVLVVYRLGTVLHDDRTVGLIAALLCAFYPLEVINGTRILSDVQVGLFASISLLLFVEAMRRRAVMWFVLSGVATACAYLANARGLLVLAAIAGCGLLMAAFRKTRWDAPLWIVTGFALIFSVEAFTYWLVTGDPLLSYHIQSGANRFKYLHEAVMTIRWHALEVRYTNGQPFQLFRSAFGLGNGPTDHFGWFFYLFAASVLYSLWRRQNWLLLTFALGLCAFLEFGAVGVELDRSQRIIRYLMVYKQERFLMMVTAPLVVLAAYFLREAGRRSRIAVVLVLVALFATSLTATSRTRTHYRAGLADLRAVSVDVRTNPNHIYWGDLWAVLHVKVFTRGRAQNLRVLDSNTTPDQVSGACVILGGSRGAELLAGYVESTLPAFARAVLATGDTPDNWVMVKKIPGARSPQQSHDLTVYCVR
jgi:4-amino-4-deoxy-L-arabinose transferase-like glycosyltransferase